jgi:predicted phage baseplate assembly protein
MTALAPNLFDRRFEDLLEIGRSRLPGLAPGWTDYNLHDPGITMLELLAWVTEAQLYGLSRTRRDERTAYAALLGLAPQGPVPATGSIWPEPGASRYTRSLVIDQDAVVVPVRSAQPAYRTTHRQLWLAGRIAALRAVGADGVVKDFGASNERGNVVFLPFGELAGPRDVLAIDIVCPAGGGLFPPRRADADDAFLMLGVRADARAGADHATPSATARLAVTLRAGAARHAIPVVDDGTAGFTTSGVLVLDVSAVEGSPSNFTLEITAPAGFPRPPRVTRIALNVLPVLQGAVVEHELHIATGLPDQVLRLQQEGLRFGAGAVPVRVRVDQDGALQEWTRADRLDDSGPSDQRYLLDPERASITFGNGVNGRMPPAGAQILLDYTICDGAAGNAMRNQQWRVQGYDGGYGVNPDPMQGGRDGSDRADQRREARRRSRDEHALVTAADLEAAAIALPALEVARAWVPAMPDTAQADNGTSTLVAMRARPGGVEPDEAPETARWLAAVERALAARLPLGRRLRLRAPAYAPFRLALEAEAQPGYRVEQVEAAIRAALQERLALTASRPGAMQRTPGLGLTQRDLAAWVRKAEGVGRILSLKLFDAANRPATGISVTRLGLPKWLAQASVIVVRRPTTGGTA